MADLEKIYEFVRKNPGKKGREIATELGLDKTTVNSILYKRLTGKLRMDENYLWWPLEVNETHNPVKTTNAGEKVNPIYSSPVEVKPPVANENPVEGEGDAPQTIPIDNENQNSSPQFLSAVNKIVSLLNYLSELTRINSKITLDLNEYRKVIWLSEVPPEPKYCFTRVWGIDDERADSWLEIKKFAEPQCPKVPEICAGWINVKNLKKVDLVPELEKTITVEELVDQTVKETTRRVLKLVDFPDVQKSWGMYLENEWKPWVVLYKRHLAVLKVYSDLFFIKQELQKLGEQYELVFSFGYLSWKTPLGDFVKRHLITAKASIEFEPNIGVFTIGPPSDGEQAEVELDMIDLKIQPQNSKKLIDDGRDVLKNNLWDKASMNALLSSLANSLAEGGQGEYRDALKPSLLPPNSKPIVEYAPALILRKRSMRGLQTLLAKIRELVKEGSLGPLKFLDLCESMGVVLGGAVTDYVDDSIASNAVSGSLGNEEIYFPKLANNEQRQIIKALNRQNGVLVQGPPGTGKSHTIANIICHLLATGKRVLVTAKTGRALQVLSDKLPGEVRPLCISLLGDGVEERKSLEKSVDGILKKLDTRSIDGEKERIKKLETGLYESRKSKAEIDKRLTALREKETFKHIISKGRYSGTATAIAKKMASEKEKFGWLGDRVPESVDFVLSSIEIEELRLTLLEFDQTSESEAMLAVPEIEKNLPTFDEFKEMVRKENEFKNKSIELKEYVDQPEIPILFKAENDVIEEIAKNIEKMIVYISHLKKNSAKWLPNAMKDIVTDNEAQWDELLRLTSNHLEKINKDVAVEVDTYQIKITAKVDIHKLLSDSKVVFEHFKAGGKTGFWLFKPRVINEHGSFIKDVTINGLACSNEIEVKKLIDYLTVKQELEYIWSVWVGKAERQNDSYPMQLAEIKKNGEMLNNALSLFAIKKTLKELFGKIQKLNQPIWDDIESLQRFSNICALSIANKSNLLISFEIEKIKNALGKVISTEECHPISSQILKAVLQRDVDVYSETYRKLLEIHEKSKKIQNKNKILEKLKKSAPLLESELGRTTDRVLWSERLKLIQEAWEWGRAKTWVETFFSDDLNSLTRQRNNLEEEIQKTLETLSSELAWNYCFKRMEEKHRRHLISWKQAMTKLGKGTGKYANTHRLDAQKHLNECRDAVPAWIMPLHKVFETVEPGPGIFDVIIVDEASQCGPEGLPLLYLGKKIIVVGDDKQISPQAVGVDRQQVERLMRDYLVGFEHSDSFDIEKSLFDHGDIRFGNRVALREHFRCMPEIIRFSNDLCYQTDPLIPLRQFTPDRLDPIKTTFVAQGFREGDGQRVRNVPEAEALVEQIINCCNDKKYDGMTMGVISLQGEAQADLISELLMSNLGVEEMENRKLICGNPYTFQGDERDVIFLSMVAAPNERIGALTQMADQRRFNVAASRAQDQVWLFHSVGLNDLSVNCYRRRLLSYYTDPSSQISQALGGEIDDLRKLAYQANRMIEKPPKPFDSWFEVDVTLDIISKGYRVVPQYQFADKRIDIVIQGLSAQIAVECDGDYWHGPEEYAADMERQRKLMRQGWHFEHVRESSYYANPEKTLESVWLALNERGILPIAQEAIESDEVDGETDSVEDDMDFRNISDGNDDLVDEEDVSDDSSPELGLRFSASQTGLPSNVDEALQADNNLISATIIEILNNRPNNSCIRGYMPTFILRKWGIDARKRRRQLFEKKVNGLIAALIRKGYLKSYKSVNERIKLGWKKWG